MVRSNDIPAARVPALGADGAWHGREGVRLVMAGADRWQRSQPCSQASTCVIYIQRLRLKTHLARWRWRWPRTARGLRV